MEWSDGKFGEQSVRFCYYRVSHFKEKIRQDYLTLSLGKGVHVTSFFTEAVTFSIPVQQAMNKLYMKKPTAELSFTTYISVFDNVFWLALLGTVIACILVLTIVVWGTEVKSSTSHTGETLDNESN